ncbi:GntR family transcriptional regulator, partial [Escherichia coli]|uniref:GntR family transcriptional regulator n=1 Tax=Escherichia coli TaxID=562 RepID=UPI000BD59503
TLRTAILDGVFAPGQKLSERELCESLDVSRSCLRESLQHLQAEGLITIVPHRGPEVTDISVTLRTAILDGVFAPGQKLSERELCESLDVSRSCL